MLDKTEKILTDFGDGVMSKLKYNAVFKYSMYGFFKALFIKKQKDKIKLAESLYKQI